MYIMVEYIYRTSDGWTAKALTKDFLYIHIFNMQCLSYLFFQRLVAGTAFSLLPGQYSMARAVCIRLTGKIHVATSVCPFWYSSSSVASLSRHSPLPRRPKPHSHSQPQPIPKHLGLGPSRREKRTVTFRERGRFLLVRIGKQQSETGR